MFKVNKLDARFSGHTYYGFVGTLIIPSSYRERRTALIKFDTVRTWCIESWGPSAELDIQSGKLRLGIPETVTEWCWMSDFTQNKFRIYLKSSAEATLFKLKWC
jgi:hypothetical protein